jgi:hypothetical protein
MHTLQLDGSSSARSKQPARTQRQQLDSSYASDCSFVTEVTMTGTASVVSNEDLAELGEYELQAVYTLTGQTGSSMYMAPEVFLGERGLLPLACQLGCECSCSPPRSVAQALQQAPLPSS